MRYTPLGWAKKYEFTESDLKVACDMLDTWIDSVAMVCVMVWYRSYILSSLSNTEKNGLSMEVIISKEKN